MTTPSTVLSDFPTRTEWLGIIAYDKALALQEQLIVDIGEGKEQERLLLLEHLPVFTIGRTRDRSSLQDITHLPYPVHETNRGGKATWHGPGQLVGYPVIDLRIREKDLHVYLRHLEEVLIRALVAWDIVAQRREGLTGVWVEDRKIASIGVGVRKWISMHGFALNIAGRLDGFEAITPCGIQGVQMTSVERETGITLSVEESAKEISTAFWKIFGKPYLRKAINKK